MLLRKLSKLQKVSILLSLLIGGIFLFAFIFFPSPKSTPTNSKFSINQNLEGFYQQLGGVDTVGPVISDLELYDNLQCQFTEKVLMCFDPIDKNHSGFSLYPLGKKLGIVKDLPQGNTQNNIGDRVVDGYTIYEKFIPLYDRLNGPQYVGKPLTELRINRDLKRAEQFFENVGFYQDLNNMDSSIHLLPYGAYLCSGNCAYKLQSNSLSVKSTTIEQPFTDVMFQLGGPPVFGYVLDKPHLDDNNNIEQTYDNVIFYAPISDQKSVKIRPLPLMLGYQVEPPAPRIFHEQIVYYETGNGGGHNVPIQFDLFVAQHGGRDFSGAPITEVKRLEEGQFQQCFENYCLLYDPGAVESEKVKMKPLGVDYLKAVPPSPSSEYPSSSFSPEQVVLSSTMEKQNIVVNEEQYISVIAEKSDSNEPIIGLDGTLELTFSDRLPKNFSLPPLNTKGVSGIVIPPQTNIDNKTRVTYQICLKTDSSEDICTTNYYTVWNPLTYNFKFEYCPTNNPLRDYSIQSYNLKIEPIDEATGKFRVSEKVTYKENRNICDDKGKILKYVDEGERVLNLPEREIHSYFRSIFLKEIRLKPLEGTIFKDAYCCPANNRVTLQNFKRNSFFESFNSKDVNPSYYLETERVEWTVLFSETNQVALTYLTPPFNIFKNWISPLVNLSYLREWLFALLIFILVTTLIPATVPMLSAFIQKRLNLWLDRKLDHQKPSKKNNHRVIKTAKIIISARGDEKEIEIYDELTPN